MRISDWSSDVCSADLGGSVLQRVEGHLEIADAVVLGFRQGAGADIGLHRGDDQRRHRQGGKSEEHTSELQSLMRISYAVFCLKKKKISRVITVENTSKHQYTDHQSRSQTNHKKIT